MANFGETSRAQHVLDGSKRRGQLRGGSGVDIVHPAGSPAHDVEPGRLSGVNLVQAGAVEKIPSANKANLLKRSHATVDGHQIALPRPDLGMDLLDAGRFVARQKRRKDREPWLGYPQPGSPQARTGGFQGGKGLRAGFDVCSSVTNLG